MRLEHSYTMSFGKKLPYGVVGTLGGLHEIANFTVMLIERRNVVSTFHVAPLGKPEVFRSGQTALGVFLLLLKGFIEVKGRSHCSFCPTRPYSGLSSAPNRPALMPLGCRTVVAFWFTVSRIGCPGIGVRQRMPRMIASTIPCIFNARRMVPTAATSPIASSPNLRAGRNWSRTQLER